MFNSDILKSSLEIELRRYVGIAVRRWRWIILGFSLAVVIGGYHYLKAPRIYQTSSQVMLTENLPQIMGRRIESISNSSMRRWRDLKYEKTQHQLMAGADVADAVAKALEIHPQQLIGELELLQTLGKGTVQNPFAGASSELELRLQRLGLDQHLDLNGAIESLMNKPKGYPILGSYSVVPQRDTNLIDLVVKHPDPEWAQLLATTVGEVFVRFNLEQRRALTGEAAKWLGQQVDVQRIKLEEAELALQEFKEKNNIISVSFRDQTNITMDALKSLSANLSQTTSRRIALNARLNVLENFEGDVSTLPEFKDGRLGTIQDRLMSLRERWIDINAVYTAQHPNYQTLKRKIELTEEELRRVVEEELNGLRGSVDVLRLTESRLESEIKNLTAVSLSLNRGQLDLERLQRDRQQAEKLYTLVLQRHKETELEEMMNVNNASLIKKAPLPLKPVSPVLRNHMMLILFLGGVLALVLAIIRELLDSTIKNHEVFGEMGESFLGIFPKLESQESSERDLIISKESRSSAAECIRALRTNLLFKNPDSPPQTIAVTSASPQEGKSTIAIGLATTMAQSGSRTLLVDADMRRPRLHKTFELRDVGAGLSSLIVGEGELKDIVKSDVLPGLDLLICGPIPPNPAELLHAKGFAQLLESLKHHYDRIIFDAPPVNPVSDPMVLASMVDGVVLVVASHQTRIPALSMTLHRLNEVKANILGLVLNKVSLKIGSGYGYDQYNYNYRYYTSSYDNASENPSEAA